VDGDAVGGAEVDGLHRGADGRADAVLITARHGIRISIAAPSLTEAETLSVRRTRVFLIPF